MERGLGMVTNDCSVCDDAIQQWILPAADRWWIFLHVNLVIVLVAVF